MFIDTDRLGPQADALDAAESTYETFLRGSSPEALRYDDAIAEDWTAIETAARHALAALEAAGIDSLAVQCLGGCGWGSAAIALAARHLIGRAPGWTQEAYDTLTRPWVAAGVGPLHPADGIDRT